MAQQVSANPSTPPQRRVAHAPTHPRRWDQDPQERRHARERRFARDLIELSRLQRGGERAHPAPVDLANLVRAVHADYAPLDVAGPESAVVVTDPRRLVRILFAILDNAYVHGGSPVSLRYDTGEIVVRDSGGGFEAVLLARAAEPFVTGGHGRGRGVGLGLAIAGLQAALLGATLRLENDAAGGARVGVRFGAARPPSSVG